MKVAAPFEDKFQSNTTTRHFGNGGLKHRFKGDTTSDCVFLCWIVGM